MVSLNATRYGPSSPTRPNERANGTVALLSHRHQRDRAGSLRPGRSGVELRRGAALDFGWGVFRLSGVSYRYFVRAGRGENRGGLSKRRPSGLPDGRRAVLNGCATLMKCALASTSDALRTYTGFSKLLRIAFQPHHPCVVEPVVDLVEQRLDASGIGIATRLSGADDGVAQRDQAENVLAIRQRAGTRDHCRCRVGRRSHRCPRSFGLSQRSIATRPRIDAVCRDRRRFSPTSRRFDRRRRLRRCRRRLGAQRRWGWRVVSRYDHTAERVDARAGAD